VPPAPVQALHAPSHAPVQHTPSTQKPDWHSPDAAQPAPADFRQAPAPLHVVAPGHSSAGSEPAGSAVHVPGVPALHARHVPEQSVPQQTPSTHCPAAHCAVRAQAAPSASFCTQAPPTHASPAAQSASAVHHDGQLSRDPLQTYGAQVGAPADCAATGLQTPTLPACAHASHAPPQALPQQTPSAQWALTHSPSRLHAAPFTARCRQVPATHAKPPLQSASAPQLPRHAAEPLQ